MQPFTTGSNRPRAAIHFAELNDSSAAAAVQISWITLTVLSAQLTTRPPPHVLDRPAIIRPFGASCLLAAHQFNGLELLTEESKLMYKQARNFLVCGRKKYLSVRLHDEIPQIV